MNDAKLIPISCPACGDETLCLLYEVRHVPVYTNDVLENLLSKDEVPRGNVILGFCNRCFFITNTAYHEQWFQPFHRSEDQQIYSPTFSKYAFELAFTLVQKYDLHHKDILEIGCGKADFLSLICKLGNNSGVGIDPQPVPEWLTGDDVQKEVIYVQDYFSEKYATHIGDFICCRHTLEHIREPAQFLGKIRRAIGNRTHPILFLEVPNARRIVNQCAFEDIYYEHCSYYYEQTLVRLLNSCGFQVTAVNQAYSDQYLLLEARPVPVIHHRDQGLTAESNLNLEDIQTFSHSIKKKINGWKRYIVQEYANGKKIAIWGSGSKCVAFLATLKIMEEIPYVIDINPHRQGKFFPGGVNPIKPPEFIVAYQPDLVIVMNSHYLTEVKNKLASLGVLVETVTLS
jgi:SAM-dependent methyltransferase